jgi:hypothetical protein
MICSICRNTLEEKVLEDGSTKMVSKYKSYSSMSCPKCKGDLSAVTKEREAILHFILNAFAEDNKSLSSTDGISFILVKAWENYKAVALVEEVYE